MELSDCSFDNISVYPWCYPCTNRRKFISLSFILWCYATVVKCLPSNGRHAIPYLKDPFCTLIPQFVIRDWVYLFSTIIIIYNYLTLHFLLQVMVLLASKLLPNKIGASCITMYASHVCSKVLCQIHLPNWKVLPRKIESHVHCCRSLRTARSRQVPVCVFILPVRFTTRNITSSGLQCAQIRCTH